MPRGTAVRLNGVRKWLAAGIAVAAIGGFGAWAQEAAPEAALLIDGGRLGNLVTLGEDLDEVAARFGPLSPMPVPFAGFKMYPVPSTPPFLVAACDATGTVSQAVLQEPGPDTLGFRTAAGIGLGASEADVVAAYGEPRGTPTVVRGLRAHQPTARLRVRPGRSAPTGHFARHLPRNVHAVPVIAARHTRAWRPSRA